MGEIKVHIVEDGTVISHNGESQTVTKDQTVFNGSTLYVTKAQAEAIIEATIAEERDNG